MGTAATTVQEWIEARETVEALEYGIRSIKVCRSPYGASACHVAQITAACQAATRVLGRFVAKDAGTLRLLREAKREASEQLKAAAAEKQAIGSARQLKLALAA
jgi:hypothetical protein